MGEVVKLALLRDFEGDAHATFFAKHPVSGKYQAVKRIAFEDGTDYGCQSARMWVLLVQDDDVKSWCLNAPLWRGLLFVRSGDLSKAIQGAAMLAGAVGMGVAAFYDPALIASPMFDKIWASLVLGGISMEAGALASALTSNRGMGITTRQPAAFRQIVYGEQRVGGVNIYRSTTGSHHDQFNFVIVIAGHEIDSIVNLYLDGRQVYWLGSGGGYSVRNGVGFGGVADASDHVGPGGQTYNFGGTGHSGIYAEARYGDQLPGDVISGLTANDPNWAADGHGNSPWLGGCAYIYLKIEANADLFPQEPEIKITVRGKNNIFDPRTGAYGYTSNWALIAADILTDTQFGLGDVGSVNTDQLIASANVCDEQVAIAIGGTESRYCCHMHYDTAVSPGDALQNMMPAAAGRLSRIGGEWYIWPAYWQGPSFDFDASVLTGPLTWNPYRSFRELANRVNGTYIAANSPWNVAGNLYDANGWYNGSIANQFPFAFQPTNYPQYAQDTLHGYSYDALLFEDSGVLGNWDSTVTYALGDAVAESGVLYKSLLDGNLNNDPATHSVAGGAAGTWASGTTYAAGAAAAYQGPAYVGATTYAAGAVVSYGNQSYVSLVSSNTGNQPDISPTDWALTVTLYVSLVGSNTGNQPDISPSDWAPVVWQQWVGNVLPLEVTQSCCLSVAQAQRVAKIMLLRNRQQGSGTFPMHLAAWQMQPLDVFTMEFAPNGWSGKQLEVVSTRFFFEEQDGAQVVKFEIQAQETDSSVYDWSTAEELSVYDVPSNPAVLPYGIDPPTSLTVASSSSTAVIAKDGTVTPRILASWTAPADIRAVQVQVQYQLSGAGSWTDAGTVDAATTSVYIAGVIAGDVYLVQVRSLAYNGGTSAWVASSTVTVAAPNSLQTTYTNNPALALTNPTSTTIVVAATAVTFGGTVVNYAARTLTISAPGSPTWYYISIADPTQVGESGSPTLTATASTSNSLVGVLGNTFMGAILALPAGSATRMIPGGWPNPYASQVGV